MSKKKLVTFIGLIIVIVSVITLITILFINSDKKNDTPKDISPTPTSDNINITEPNIEVVDEKTLAIKMAILASPDRSITFEVISSELVSDNVYHVILKNQNTKENITMEANMNTMEGYQIFNTTNGNID